MAAMKMKMACQSANSRMSCPALGAMIGTIMKTVKTSDMTSAICRPPNTSRTTAMAITRVAAAPAPWMKRSISSWLKLGTNTAAAAAST